MKKCVLVLIALLALGGMAIAEAPANIEPYVRAGDMLVNGGIGYGGIAAGFEYDLFQMQVGPLPLTLGAAARASYDMLFGTSLWSGAAYGIGHISLKGVNLPSGFGWAGNCDSYIGIGVGALGIPNNSTGMALGVLVGEAYYLSDKLAIYFEYNRGIPLASSYPWYWNIAAFGVTYKI